MTGTITTVGSDSVPAKPDWADVHVDVAATRASADEALADVAERVERATALVHELGIDQADWSTSGVSVGEHREWGQDGPRLLGYRAVTRLALRVRDDSLLGRLLTEAVRRCGAEVRGPFWAVAPDNPAQVDAYRLAAVDARRRADAYAEALGVRLGAILSIKEGAPDGGPMPVRGVLMAAKMGGGAELDVNPGTVDVSAAVTVTFAIGEPSPS